MNYKPFFQDFYVHFQKSVLFTDMCEVTENSAYHREKNVGVHTQMVISYYINHSPDIWHYDHLMGAIACLFHDVGKPKSRTTEINKQGQPYSRFLGHEQISCRLFEDYMAKNWGLFTDTIYIFSIYTIGWMIQHHLPYGTKKINKISVLRNTIDYILPNHPEVFDLVLISDQCGRISDDHQTKIDNGKKWVKQFNQTDIPDTSDGVASREDPILYMLIAPSSGGKSTIIPSLIEYVTERNRLETHVFSWDQMRLEQYQHPDADNETLAEIYEYAFKQSCIDTNFYPDSLKRFNKLVKKRDNIIVDNMNLSEKRRKQFTDCANNNGYLIVNVLLPINISQLCDRNQNRKDRAISNDDVINMYMRLSYPSISPFCHEILVMDVNINEKHLSNEITTTT